jgi:hypothetical protein
MKKIIVAVLFSMMCSCPEMQCDDFDYTCFDQCFDETRDSPYCDELCRVKEDASVNDAGQPDYGAHTCLSYCVSGEYKYEECMAVFACCQAVCQ